MDCFHTLSWECWFAALCQTAPTAGHRAVLTAARISKGTSGQRHDGTPLHPPLREPKTDFNPTMRPVRKARGLGAALTGRLNGILTSRQKTLIAFNWTSITCDQSGSCCKLSHSTCPPVSHRWAPAHESLRERESIVRTFKKWMACYWSEEIRNIFIFIKYNFKVQYI